MSRIEDLTEYFGTVRRGYNRAHFADRVKELSILVDAAPLAPDDFNALFKIWLALRIPIKTWSNIGSCLIPAGPVDDDLIGYAARWCLSGLYAEMSPSRLGFVLNWLTAALDHNLVSAKAMDGCYGAFQIVFQYERYSTYAAKLMYKLTKPHDVCRFWTLSLLNLLTQRNAARDRAQITALLGLYKSYKPECVPESVPAISVHSAFPKINATLLNRFRRVQNHRNTVDTSGHLSWRNNLRAMGKLGKGKAPPLIPDLEFIQFGSQLYSDSGEKNYLHFNDAESVLAHALQRRTRRPAQLLSLLCNDTGAALLSTMPAEQHTFLSHELKHQLDACFLQDDRLYRREEKADLLRRLGRFQQLLLQPVPVVSDFLVKYLVFWNGCDYFEEVLRLCEWVQLGSWAALRARVLAPLRLLYLTVAPPARRAILRTFSALYSDYLVLRLCEWVQLGSWAALRARVLAPLRLLYLTVAPPARRAILRTFSALYSNLAYTRTKQHNLFLDSPPERDLEETLSGLAGFLQDLCTQSLRIYPVDAENLSSCLRTCEELTQAELTHGAPHCSVAPPLVAGLALASPSAHALNSLAGLLLRERKVFARLRRQTGGGGLRAQEHRLLGYRGALAACLWRERALTERADGPLLGGMPQARVDRLIERFPRADRTFGLARHPALAPYTYGPSDHVHARTVSRDAVLAGVVAPMFPELARLVEKLADKDA